MVVRRVIPPAMANTKQVGFRWPDELVERLDAYAAHVRRETGLNVSRAQAALRIMERGLTAEGFPPGKASQPAAAKKRPGKAKR